MKSNSPMSFDNVSDYELICKFASFLSHLKSSERNLSCLFHISSILSHLEFLEFVYRYEHQHTK